jgi:hypothetical protein
VLLSQLGSAPGASAQSAGGWDGRFLRLTDEVNSQQNFAGFNQAVAGAYDRLQIDLDFRISAGNGGGADGIGLAYANSALFGADTSSPNPGYLPEEPNLTDSFGVGFDTFNNTDQGDGGENSVSLHWDGARVDSVAIDTEPDIFSFENDTVYTASIAVVPSGAGSNVTVSITDGTNTITPFTNEFIAGLTPYDGRIVLAGRTGGANAFHDVDNVRLTHTPVGGTPTVAMFENFTSALTQPPPAPPPVPATLLGGTPFESSQFASMPGPTVTQGNGPAATDGYMRLTIETGNQNNAIAFDRTAAALGSVITADFDYRILHQSLSRADGMSFLLIPTDQYDDSGPLPQFVSEEANLAGSFGVGFDTFDNTEEGDPLPDLPDTRANHVSLHWDGQIVPAGDAFDFVFLDPATEIDLVNDVWNHATVTLEQVEGGANVSVELTDGTDGSTHLVYDRVFVPDVAFADGVRPAFTARTGGAGDFHDIDNLVVRFGEEALIQPGDSDRDGDFDQLDLVRVQIGAKYLSGQQASWGEGDWNGAPAPGGTLDNPPPGDSRFDQIDIIAALNAGKYLTGPYLAVKPAPGGWESDEQTSLVYNATTGELSVNAPASKQLTSINIDSAAGVFTGAAAQNLGGSFDNDSDANIFKATFGSSFGSLTFGNVAQPGLSQQFVLGDLTVVGSLAGGGALGEVDLVYVPEPSTIVLFGLALLGFAVIRRRGT